MKARYLSFFSYIGTGFRSSEKLWFKSGRNHPDPESVQGTIESALLKLRSINYPNLVLSSRTDGGVHALNCSGHFDLDRYGSNIYDPGHLTYTVNKYFHKNSIGIYVQKCIRVNDNFNARFYAKSRTYLYRLAVLKQGITLPENTTIASYIPIEEWKRCTFLRINDFHIERFKEGAKHLVGLHDFTTFKKFDKLKQNKHNRRVIYSIDVSPGTPQVTSHTRNEDTVFDYWDIKIHARAFVHNQIRRMLGTLVSVGVGKLKPEDVQVMLQIPSKHSWHNFIQCLPPDGLYLCNVEYDPKDLIYDPDSQITKDQEFTNEEDEDVE